MPKKHLKRIAAPRTWNIERKRSKFITRPFPSGHSFEFGLPINVLLKEYLGHAETSADVKHIMLKKQVFLDGIQTKEPRRLVGLMDVLSLPDVKEHHRLVLNSRGKLVLVKADAQIKPCRIISKTAAKGNKIQIGLHDGSTFLTDKNDYKVGDTLVLKLPGRDVQSHLSLEKGALIYLTGGRHIAQTATVENISGKKITAKLDKDLIETLRKFAFVIGKDNAVISTNDK